jgi:hypothetical protein
MTQVTLHPTPRARDVVREQVRVVGLGLLRQALVLAIVLGIVTVVIATDIARGNAATWFDSEEWSPIGLVAFLLPFAVWRTDRPFGPAFFWTLPVDRRRLALARVFAGWVWLMTALAVFVSWQLALAALSGVARAETVPFIAFPGATALYLLGSAVVLGLRHPLRWLFGTAGVVFLLGTLNHAVDTLVSSSLFDAPMRDAMTAWETLSAPAQWAIASFLWVGAGLIALWVAVSRHGERRRR